METEQLIKEKDRAWRAWQQAINHFNNVTSKEDVDLAVFDMETKKRQYMRLTEEIRREKTAVPQEPEASEVLRDFDDVPERRTFFQQLLAKFFPFDGKR